MNKQFIGNDFSQSKSLDKLTPDKVDLAADVNMPLCMKVCLSVCMSVILQQLGLDIVLLLLAFSWHCD
jgi:hypothetical protein